MALTIAEIKNIKAIDKPVKASDGGGLFLLAQPNKAKYWQLAHRFAGKQKTLALGVFPGVSLADARERREEARKLLASGIDPSENRKAIKSSQINQQSNSFEVIAREWYTSKSAPWVKSHSSKIIARLERDIFPWLGSRVSAGFS